jgi:hypothetical protein
MKNEKLEKLKNELGFIELDQRLEMVKIPMLSSLACDSSGDTACTYTVYDENGDIVEEGDCFDSVN